MDNSVRQHAKEPQKLTRYQRQKERMLQKLFARLAKAEKIRESEKRKAA
jgi:ribosomal protein L17